MRIKTLSKCTQVAAILRRQVLQGKYGAGGRIPTEPELCNLFKVGRNSIREAVSSLAHEGLLVKSQGQGTFVAEGAGSRTGEIAIVVSVADTLGCEINPLYWEGTFLQLKGVLDAAGERKIRVRKIVLGEQEPSEILESLLDGRPLRGVLFFHTAGYEPYIEQLLQADVRVASFSSTASAIPGVFPVVFDRRAGARLVFEHLAQQGHRRIACLLEADPATVYYRHKIQAYREVTSAFGLDTDERLIVPCGPSIEQGFIAARALFQNLSPRPAALFAASDFRAVGALLAAKALDICIPDNLAIAGFLGLRESRQCDPPLTTVAAPFYEMGCEAVRILATFGDVSAAPVLPMRLIVRGSTEKNCQSAASMSDETARTEKAPSVSS